MKNDLRYGYLLLALFLSLHSFSQTLPEVDIKTPVGNILVQIDTVNAPLTAKNFLMHVDSGTYKNSVFYRVVRMDNQPKNEIKIEVIQGGVFVEIQFEKIKPIKHETTKETGILHLDGTISMARMAPGTASTEFFICVNDQPELDYGGKRNPDGQGFAAFGQVIKGMDVVRKIQNMKDKEQTLTKKVKILDFLKIHQ